MLITTKYDIGQAVWIGRGVYDIPHTANPISIKALFDNFGRLQILYLFDASIRNYENWYNEDEVFQTEEQLIEYLNDKYK